MCDNPRLKNRLLVRTGADLVPEGEIILDALAARGLDLWQQSTQDVEAREHDELDEPDLGTEIALQNTCHSVVIHHATKQCSQGREEDDDSV